jgi:Flp pilus assembly protein TadD
MKLCDLPSAALLLVLGSFFTSPAQSSGERDAFARQAAIRAQGTSGSSPEVEKLKRSATRRIQGGDLKSAEGDLRKAVALAPNDVAALTLLGGVLSTQHRLEESSTFYEKALQLDPANPNLRRNLAANQLQLGQNSTAIKNLQALLKSKPGDRQAMLMLGLAWERVQDFPRAIASLEQVPELVQQETDAIAALVRSYYRTGQKDKARRRLSQLQDSSASPATIYLGGQMAMEAKDWDAAEELFASIQATHPKPSLVAYQLARIRLETGRFGESRMLLEPIANSPESNGSVFYLLAWCYLKEGNEEMAKKIMFYAIDRFPEEPANFVDFGKLCLKDNSLDEGLKVVQRGAARHPGSSALFELKGELESKQGFHALAVESYRQAVRLNPRSPEAMLGLSLTQTNLLQTKDAVASFEKGLKLFPRDARFHAEYGKVLLQPWASGEIPGREVKAERLLKRAAQLDDSLAIAHFELGTLLLRNQRAAEALPHLEKAAKLDAGNAQAHFVLARAYRALDRTQDAEREMLLFQNLQLEPAAPGKESAPPRSR